MEPEHWSFKGAPPHPACSHAGDPPAQAPVFGGWLTATYLIKPAASELQFMKEAEAGCERSPDSAGLVLY